MKWTEYNNKTIKTKENEWKCKKMKGWKWKDEDEWMKMNEWKWMILMK